MIDGHRPGAAARTAPRGGIAPRIPDLVADRCVGCLACVNACPDAALHAVALPVADAEGRIDAWAEEAEQPRLAAVSARARFALTGRFADVPARQGVPPAELGIFVDPLRCKGCAACVEVCDALGHHALVSIATRTDEGTGESTLERYRRDLAFLATLPPTPGSYRSDRPADLVLGDSATAYQGLDAACAGCGPSTMLRLLATTVGHHRPASPLEIVAAPVCDVVSGWADAFGPGVLRHRADDLAGAIEIARALRTHAGGGADAADRRTWVVAGDADLDGAGRAALDALLASGLDIGVLVLATAAPWGSDLAIEALTRGTAYVARTTAAHLVHAVHTLGDADAFPGPALIVAYTPCQPVHGIAEDLVHRQARLAVEARVAPLFSHDPRRGAAMRERLSLQGNPGIKEDRVTAPDGTPFDPIAFARTEGRFAAHFAKDGRPSSELRALEAERLAAWRSLQERAGVR